MHHWALDSNIESFSLVYFDFKSSFNSALLLHWSPDCSTFERIISSSDGSRQLARDVLTCRPYCGDVGLLDWGLDERDALICLDNLRKALGRKSHVIIWAHGPCLCNLQMIIHHWTCYSTTAGLSAETTRLSLLSLIHTKYTHCNTQWCQHG